MHGMSGASQPLPRIAGETRAIHPVRVLDLYEREQEVAIVVYRRGCATANEVQDRLSDPLSNGAVRSMLNRLVGKRILKRQRRGPHGAFVYLPALTDEVIEERALRQLANDFFDGSLFRTAAALDKLVARLSMRSNRWPAE